MQTQAFLNLMHTYIYTIYILHILYTCILYIISTDYILTMYVMYTLYTLPQY